MTTPTPTHRLPSAPLANQTPQLSPQSPKYPSSTPSFTYRIPPMESLHPPFPSANLAVRKLRPSIAAANPTQGNKATSDFVQEALMSADTKRPWWAPIFQTGGSDPEASERKGRDPATGSGAARPKPQSFRSSLTEEKARVLRKEMRAMESWHDPMYHSAIAARLASPDQS